METVIVVSVLCTMFSLSVIFLMAHEKSVKTTSYWITLGVAIFSFTAYLVMTVILIWLKIT